MTSGSKVWESLAEICQKTGYLVTNCTADVVIVPFQVYRRLLYTVFPKSVNRKQPIKRVVPPSVARMNGTVVLSRLCLDVAAAMEKNLLVFRTFSIHTVCTVYRLCRASTTIHHSGQGWGNRNRNRIRL